MVERMKPARGKILVKVLKEEARTVSGLYIPESVADSKEIIRGTVLATGPGYIWEGKEIPLDTKVGTTVIFKYFSGYFIDPEKYYMIVEDKDILTVVEEE